MILKKLFLCVMLFLFLTTTTAAHERLAINIIIHRDFFLRLDDYSDYLLNDVENIERGNLLGIVLLSPEGLEQRLVYDATTMRQVYANARVLSKDSRAFLTDASIRMSDVKKLAYAAELRATELNRVRTQNGGKPGDIVQK